MLYTQDVMLKEKKKDKSPHPRPVYMLVKEINSNDMRGQIHKMITVFSECYESSELGKGSWLKWGGPVRKDLSVNGALLLKCEHREGFTPDSSSERALQTTQTAGASHGRPENA